MKNFSRTQKKGILSARVIDNNRLNSSIENFDEMIEKQLEDDFKVFEYLNENPNDGHNTQEYISLFNTLLVKKFNKIKRKQLLKSTKAQFETPCQKSNDSRIWSKSQVKSQNADNSYYSQEQYLRIKQQSELQQEIIESKTQQQLEMKRVLIKEITQNKKSLNLLKGDIGHMIARNQSISVLQSKVNKVSLVSENQLKRVSMALTKDKEEVQLRQQMQKKFHAKLRGVENIETRNLKKIKLNFIESMKRRKQIFDNLSLIQKECASIEQYSDKIKIKQQKNSKSLSSFKLLIFMSETIKSCKLLWEKFQNKEISSHQYDEQLQNVFKYDGDMIKNGVKVQQVQNQVENVSQEILAILKDQIICEYHRLDNQIFEKKKVYNQHLSKIEQFWVKISQQQKKQNQIITEFNIQQRNQLSNSNFVIQTYFHTFASLKRNFNIIYFLIGYLDKKFNNFPGKEITNQLYINQCYHVKIQEDQSKREGADRERNGNIRDSGENFNQFVCLQLQNKFQVWFRMLKDRVRVWMGLGEAVRKDLLKKAYAKVRVSYGALTERDADNGSQAKINEDYDSEEQNQEVSCKKMSNQPNVTDQKSTKQTKSTFHQSKNEQQTAKRIQILQKIDQSYYRMIKETIQMQKQNTMKNYQFQRTFKRNKYSSQDSLLEEKRFQATFSSLFKQDPDENCSKIKIKQENSKGKKTQGDEIVFGKTQFSSMHAQSKSKLFNSSTFSFKRNASYMEKHKKSRLRSKLKDVLTRV